MEVAFLIAVCLVSFVTASLAIPRIMRVAVHKKLLDYPDEGRRGHARPVPRLGGIAVFVAFLMAMGAATLLSRVFGQAVPRLPATTIPLLLACSILFGIGLLDDLKGVRPIFKLLGQTLAALIVVRAGFQISVLGFPPIYEIPLGWLSIPVTVLWLVGVSNAFNLIDGLDGLSGGVGVVALITVVASKSILGGMVTPLYSIALAGALLGFLRYNFSPARIFLGDSGSLVVGFLLAYLTVRGATRSDGVLLTLVPICALAYPLLDTGISMLRRWLRGEPLSRADGRHIHHQLRALGLGPRRSVLAIYALSLIVAVLGLCATFAPPRFTIAAMVLASAVLVGIVGYGLPWLQYHEFLEVGSSFASVLRSGHLIVRDKIHARDLAESLRTSESFERLNDVLEVNAGRFRFVHMELQGRSEVREYMEPVEVQLHGALTWKLEYPVTRDDSQVAYPIHLSIWCSIVGTDASLSAERVAKILAPTIATWLASNWERQDVQTVLAKRFPGLHTPPFSAVTGDFAIRSAEPIRRVNR